MRFLKLFVNLFHFNRTNWKAVALCFVTAAIFWLFNALNKTYSTSIRFPLQFEFDQQKFAPVGQLPQSILINVNGTGWDLFRKYFGVKVPKLTIPLERPAETRKIVASTLPVTFAGQMGNIQINHVVLDTIHLQIEPRVFRKFPLAIDTTAIAFKDEIGQTGPVIINPDSVDLSGPVSIIHNLPETIFLQLPDRRIGGNFHEEVEVQLPEQEFIQRDPPVVEVAFDAGEFVSVRQTIRLEADRLPWGYVPMQDSVTCSFRVPAKSIGKFNATEVYATLPPITEEMIRRGETKRFAPIVHSSIPFLQISEIDTVSVKHY